MTADGITRISIVLGIHQALGTLYPTERDAIAWLRTRNAAPMFGGRPPMALVISGSQDGLMSVRRFLDAACGGLYMAPNEIDRAFRPYEVADIFLT